MSKTTIEKTVNSAKSEEKICKVCNGSARRGTKDTLLCRACGTEEHLVCVKARRQPMALPNAEPGAGAHLYCEKELCSTCSQSTCPEACSLPSHPKIKDLALLSISIEMKYKKKIQELEEKILRVTTELASTAGPLSPDDPFLLSQQPTQRAATPAALSPVEAPAGEQDLLWLIF